MDVVSTFVWLLMMLTLIIIRKVQPWLNSADRWNNEQALSNIGDHSPLIWNRQYLVSALHLELNLS